MTDWKKNQQLLLEGARKAFQEFFTEHPNEQVCSVGFVFELGNASAQFDACAHVSADLNGYRQQEADYRWNSGSFTHPAGLTSTSKELGAAWDAEVERLYGLAFEEFGDGPLTKEIYDGYVLVASEVLVTLASEGLFGDWHNVDFNVAGVNDSTDLIQNRDLSIRSRLQNAKGK